MSEPKLITVVCTNSGHEGQTVKLLSFRGLPSDQGDGATIWWSPMRNRSRSSKPGRNQDSKRNGWASSDDAVRQSQVGDAPTLPDDYRPINLQCPRCGYAFTATDWARLDPVLTTFFQHAVTEIPVAVLRRAYSR